MAENVRDQDPSGTIEARRRALVVEARRQEESCLYTSTTMYIWLRKIRCRRNWFVSLPIVLGSLASLKFLSDAAAPTTEPTSWLGWAAAILSFLAGLFPALGEALKIETNVDEVSRQAAEFKSLQDRFRRFANVTVLGDISSAEARLEELMERMDMARSSSLTPPEKMFLEAQKKIKAGHYSFSVDESSAPEK